ncbi:MAG: SH3 domain-containing protein [Deltaproteobacteria bacterium]|nr:SH3 domain-containing protein [Deltaproteobacteria bacterium]
MNIPTIMLRYLILIIFLIFINAGSAMAERLTVVASIANIRSGPGSEYEILWKVEKYYPIVVLKKSKSWYHFKDFEDDKGWIHKSLLGNISAVITKKDRCNIRSGPGTDNDILFTVEKGVPFKVIKRKGRWLHIEHVDGDKGWIYDSLVW